MLAGAILNKGCTMAPIFVHYALTLDLTGRTDTDRIIDDFLRQTDISHLDKSVEMLDEKCTIRFMVEGPETLLELREVLRNIPRGIFAEVTRAAIRGLKERPNDLYLALTARPPLFGLD